MFTSLYEYGKHNDIEESWTKEEYIPFIVHIKNGEFSHVENNARPKHTKEAEGGKIFTVPRQNFLSSAILGSKSKFLCDDVKRIFGTEKDSCREHFTSLIKESKIDFIQPIVSVIESSSAKITEAINTEIQKKPVAERLNQKALFYIDGEPSINAETIAYWKNHVESSFAEENPELKDGVCSITNKISKILDSMPSNINIGTKGGANLFSFNANAYESYGLERTNNCAISYEAANRISAVINNLLEKSQTSGISKLLGGSHFICWTSNPEDDVNFLLNPRSEDVLTLVESLKNGLKPKSGNFKEAVFYAAIIEGDKRLVVKSYYQDTVSNLKKNILNWYEGIQIWNEKPKSLFDIMSSFAPVRGKNIDMAEIPKPFTESLLKSIFFGEQISEKIVQLILRRQNSEVLGSNQFGGKVARCGLIKTYLIRKGQTMEDIENSNAFKIGKLLAIAGNAQYHASDGKTDTVIGEFWTKFSTNPYNYISNLQTKVVKAYIPKIGRDDKGKAFGIQKEISGLVASLDMTTIKPFTTKEKLTFIFGFETQRNNYFSKSKNTGNSAKTTKNQGE